MSANIGFGCSGEVGEHCFVVDLPRAMNQPITIVEDYGVQAPIEVVGERKIRAVIDRPRWDAISETLRVEFNRRLRDVNRRSGRWQSGEVPVDRLLGKELVVLAWGTEDVPADKIPQAIANWLGLKPEERWWLYTTTAAATGDAIKHRGIGWRKALATALTENPVTLHPNATQSVPPHRPRLRRREAERNSGSLFSGKRSDDIAATSPSKVR